MSISIELITNLLYNNYFVRCIMNDNYINFSDYSTIDILRMQKEKKKEYIILTQSEKIAKLLLSYYGQSLYTTNYHYRVNSEYNLLQERVTKKRLLSDYNVNDDIIRIPITSIVLRLKDSENELAKINKLLSPTYSNIINEIISTIKDLDITILYANGNLYSITEEEEILIDDNSFNEIFYNEKGLNKTKTLK